MALTLPSFTDLAAFQNEAEVEDEKAATAAIQQAADLVWMATQLDADPVDPRLGRVVKNAIMDMAWFLLVQTADKEETYSSHSTERIGSYSYVKSNSTRFTSAQQAIALGGATGVFWFDSMVNLLGALEPNGTGIAFTNATQVFHFDHRLDDPYPLLHSDVDPFSGLI